MLVVASASVQADPPIDCLAYWQLRAEGLSREHGIASSKLSQRYFQQYRASLAQLKTQYELQQLATKQFEAIATMLAMIDGDYARAAELDASYSASCPLPAAIHD